MVLCSHLAPGNALIEINILFMNKIFYFYVVS